MYELLCLSGPAEGVVSANQIYAEDSLCCWKYQ